MFPSFESNQDRTNKRNALYDRYTRELENDELKRQAYATALWASDVEKNQFRINSNNAGDIYQMMANVPTTSNNNINSNNNNNNNNAGDVYQMMANPPDAPQTNPPDASQTNPPDASQTPSPVFSDEAARQEIKQLYTDTPKLEVLQISPISAKDNKLNDKYYFGKQGDLYNSSGQNANKKVGPTAHVLKNTDWIASLNYIQKKGLPSVSFMNNAPQRQRERISKFFEDDSVEATLKKDKLKDKYFGVLYGNTYYNDMDADRAEYRTEQNIKDEGLADIAKVIDYSSRYSVNLNTKAGSDEDIKAALDALVANNPDLVKKYPIVAILNDGTAIGNEYKFNPYLMQIVNKNGKQTKATERLQKEISWKDTYDAWLQKLDKSKQLSKLITANTNIQINKGKRGLDDSFSSQQADTSKPRLSEINEGYHNRIKYLFSRFDGTDYALHKYNLPIVIQNSSTGKYEIDERYIWGRNGVILKSDTLKPPSNLDNVMKTIRWGRSYLGIKHFLKENLFKKLNSDPKTKNAVSMLSRFVDETDALSLTMDDIDDSVADFMSMRGKGVSSKLVGRGLKGAGRVGLRGYSCTSKNLRSIQGTGSASDLKYKQLGSKFIRITDLRLDPPKLKLVYPNRTQVGKIIEISRPLAKCIEHLAFEQDINQQMYNKLKINDKQAVHDLLRLCHLDTTFLNPIADPLETLQAEYDKLRSQVLLGNDNPDNIRELKTLSLDLYNKQLLSEDQMREILSL